LANQRAAPIANTDLSGVKSAANIWQNHSINFQMLYLQVKNIFFQESLSLFVFMHQPGAISKKHIIF
jgi:hypothetical protein